MFWLASSLRSDLRLVNRCLRAYLRKRSTRSQEWPWRQLLRKNTAHRLVDAYQLDMHSFCTRSNLAFACLHLNLADLHHTDRLRI